MFKLLVNSPSGQQLIEYVDETGSYYDASKVLWDERQRGAMPPVELGKMQLVGNDLVTLDEFLPSHAAAVYARSVPVEVPMTAAREALIDAGLLNTIDAYIQTLGQKDIVWWQFSQSINRQFPLVEQVKVALAMTDQQIDQLFIAAEQIRKQRAGEV